MAARGAAAILLGAWALLGCSGGDAHDDAAGDGTPAATPDEAAPDEGAPEETAPDEGESGWTVTVYYTAVESHHDGEPVAVTGCPVLDCTHGDSELGSYPEDFVTAVQQEGTGRIVHGPHAGEYLNWSWDVGYWLDSAPRDSYGAPLEPFVSAAADAGVLARGDHVRIEDCGTTEEGEPIEPEVCETLSAASWVVTDEFTPGFGGDHHMDAYIGEETGPGFTDSPLYTTLNDATLTVTHA
ncbi:hypothetical protein D7294_03910 [Streptomyces hoynatensis]|uniref:Uncharacterized protein n=1 Tax=Streptomyces hoynatensis TaxID=1141874 RepID=A0A3A9ZED9_9ACTN|nr:hypothetical protein D7294_03910 [Streptomyces hoynatensis]